MVVLDVLLRYVFWNAWKMAHSHLLMLVGGRTCLAGGGTPHLHAWDLFSCGDLEVSSRQTVSEEDMIYLEGEDIPQIYDCLL